MIGQVVNYRYEILEKCGDGSFFAVYKARDKVLNRLVAVKILLPQYAANVDFAERVIAETHAVSQLSHPNSVKIYEADHQNNVYFIAMEYIRGIKLKDKIRRLAPFSPAQALDLTIAIGEALQDAHAHSITHGDVRPQNVLVTSDSQVKVTDFGMASALSSFPSVQSGAILRSVQYMSPEVAEGKVARPSSDVYSLGITLFEMLTGAVPFDGDTAIAIALHHAKDAPPSPRALNAGIPKSVEAIILKAMEKAPEDRYRTMQEMLQDLRAARQNLTTPNAYSAEVEPRPVAPKHVETEVEEREAPTLLSKALKVAFVLFALGLVALSAMLAYLFSGFGNPGDVDVPTLVGRTFAEAEVAARQAGLNLIEVERTFKDEYPEGQIWMTDPEAGYRVKKGKTVRVWISKGSKFARVPDIVGMSQDKGTSEITGAGLVVGTVTQEYSKRNPGDVTRQSPAPGTTLERGKTVSFFISMGPEPGDPEDLNTDTETTSGTESTATERKFTVTVPVPSSGPQVQRVRIVVEDENGEQTPYDVDHQAGDIVRQVVTTVGKPATVRVYIDNTLWSEQKK